MANRGVLGLARPGLERTYDNLARVGADPHLERHLPLSPHAVAIASNLFLHPEGCIERALRMILVSDRGTEQRENPVPGGLNDVTVITAHRIDHQLERGIDNGARQTGEIAIAGVGTFVRAVICCVERVPS